MMFGSSFSQHRPAHRKDAFTVCAAEKNRQQLSDNNCHFWKMTFVFITESQDKLRHTKFGFGSSSSLFLRPRVRFDSLKTKDLVRCVPLEFGSNPISSQTYKKIIVACVCRWHWVHLSCSQALLPNVVRLSSSALSYLHQLNLELEIVPTS